MGSRPLYQKYPKTRNTLVKPERPSMYTGKGPKRNKTKNSANVNL